MNDGLPGADLIEAGLQDLRAGRETIASLLVAIGATRLRRLGLSLPDSLPANPEHRLYELLAQDDSDSEKQGITLRTKLEEFLSNLPNESQRVH